MPARKAPPPPVTQNVSGDNNVVIAGNKNTVNQTVNQTFIQKFFQFFAGDAETTDQRNRRIMLGHVENFWVKGILEKSLYGAALLDLGIKEDPDAVKTYPWAIQRESTHETLPAGTPMLEIFQTIGLGRSLLILGAPGSGKTTMLLELARQLIERARQDATEPIPVVFNLASWTEKLTLTEWLAEQLNVIYYVPQKVAPTWVKENKMLLLLDGLDEVKQESRDKCVDAINAFRKENGLTSLAVCSRSQDYADLNTKLSFEGAIEVQPLTQEQITEFFNRFGKEMAGIKQVLKKDSALREMAETPLFLSIMIMAYRDKQHVEILISGDEKSQRKHLFDTYIERMFERPHSNKMVFKKQDILHWLSSLAGKMIEHNEIPYELEKMQSNWLGGTKRIQYNRVFGLAGGLAVGLAIELSVGLAGLTGCGLAAGLAAGLAFWSFAQGGQKIFTLDSVSWSWNKEKAFLPTISGLLFGLCGGPIYGLLANNWLGGLLFGPFVGLIFGLFCELLFGLSIKQVDRIAYPGQRLVFTAKNSLFISLLVGLMVMVVAWGVAVMENLPRRVSLESGLMVVGLFGSLAWLIYGGLDLIEHYTLRLILARSNLLPWRLIPFLDHCTDLIFLRRVGGGYIFVHRLLMEHFAAMYTEPE
jgi:hypothetical protein